APVLLLPLQSLALQAVMDLPRALVDEEQATRCQNDVPPGDGIAEHFEQRPGEADDPGNRGKQCQTSDQRQRQSNLPRSVLLFGGQSAGQDRDEHQIVDAEYDLKGGQCQKARPYFRINYPMHSDSPSTLRLEIVGSPRLQDCAICRRASAAARSISVRSSAS